MEDNRRFSKSFLASNQSEAGVYRRAVHQSHMKETTASTPTNGLSAAADESDQDGLWLSG